MSLIASYYDTAGSIPREVMLAFAAEEEDVSLLSEYLTLLAGHKIAVKIPERGDGRALCKLAEENAAEAARQMRLESEREDRNIKRISELLALPERPRRIEAYDISNISGDGWELSDN
mgnify:CR=1 FL=1